MPGDFGPSVVPEKVLPKPYIDDEEEDDYEDHNYLSTYLAYKKLTSKYFQLTLARGIQRVKFFQSYFCKQPELVPGLGELEGYFIEVRDLMSNLGTKNNFALKATVIHRTKKILRTWEGIENMLLQPKLKPVPADYPRPESVPSAWLFEREWRDEAYEEILLLRKKYSHLLDHAYLQKCALSMKRRGVGGLLPLSFKKLLKFLGSSREDIGLMSVKKCYKRVMGIKAICIPMKQDPLDTQKLTDQIQIAYWRDEIYEQIVASRKNYSLKLDKLLRDEVNKQKSSERCCFLEESLEFLANFRDGIALLAEEYCREQLDAMKQFMEGEEDSLGDFAQANEMINWRDLAYDSLQNKRLMFNYDLYDVYLACQPMWSKIPACDENLKKLESHMKLICKFYNMSRGEMLMWYKSKRDFYWECWFVLREYVKEAIDLMHILLGSLKIKPGSKIKWSCEVLPLIPKIGKAVDHLNP